MTRLAIPEALRARQTRASDPMTSVWVSANAGSGKTHVLTQRVIRLLLAGTPPAKILCLTFTKAAAAQMATRIHETLSQWALMGDAALRAAVAETGAPAPSAAELLLARRLFTRTVETPGGLKIQTIHAFCERLLHLFPFEANVPARFAVADELQASEILALAKRDAIEAAQRSAGPDGAALALVAEIAGPFGLDKPLREAFARRATARHAWAGGQADLFVRLGGIDPQLASTEAAQDAVLRAGILPSRWPDIASALENGGKSDQLQAKRLRAADAALATGARAEAVAQYRAVFVGDDGPRARLVTRAVETSWPGLKGELEDERTRVVAALETLKIAEAVERTGALLHLVDAVASRYERAKAARGLLDFDDLIERTLALLRRSEAGWVLHKLDAGIDHVLVDEAQDTSEAQWEILERLTGDFASGLSDRALGRSFFAVGDDKQSIFSFQGAAPLMFDTMRAAFERRFRAGEKRFERVALKTSFRSVPGVLAAVDALFEHGAHGDGLVRAPDIWPAHESIRATLPGLVEIWPRIKAEAPPEPDDWKIPLDMASERDPASLLADRIARKIAMLLAAGSAEYVHDRDGRRRPVQAGDVLILVRTRGPFFEAVIRALKHHRVPVAGADRLDLARHIAVMDLAAAGRAALLFDDDLSVACVLKSPLFGFDDDDLIALAPGRTGRLIDALEASDDSRHRAAHATLSRWHARAAATTPFAFFIELLGRDGGRRLMEARLGPEAHDAMDEFLRLALLHEQNGAPSLTTFLAEIEALDTSVKRDMEEAGSSVRVMTVHAAKGLEAKIVFLPDTCGVPAPALDPAVFDLAKDTGRPPELVWSVRKADDPPVVAAARLAERRDAMREYRRLLYVATTRAEERLYLAGFFSAREPPDDCWNAMITAALDRHATETVPAFWSAAETVKRLVTPGQGGDVGGIGSSAHQPALGLAPEWLFRNPARDFIPVALRPSDASGEVHSALTAERRRVLACGAALHQLLQMLPALSPSRREDAGRAFLASAASACPRDEHDALLREALDVIALPELAQLFGPHARAEVAVSGRIAGAKGTTAEVPGIVDRLVVTESAVLIADFKRGRPQREVPQAYLAQLALYRRLLAPLWPDLPVRAFLVWTEGPQVVELAETDLDRVAIAALA